MKARIILSFAMLCLVIVCGYQAWAQAQKPFAPHKPSEGRQEKIAADRESTDGVDNGIYISSPKVYDDASLQLMLNAARAQLASVQGINQAGLLQQIGAVTGGTSVQNAFSAQISGGPSIPQVATVANGATSQQQVATGGATPGTTLTTTAPNQVVTTTATPPTIPTAALPTSAGFSPPASFGVNALGALNEQLQLTYEIANVSLLLEGSLTDRFVGPTTPGEIDPTTPAPIDKRRTTLGFPITITPRKEYKNAVAVVEVEIKAPIYVFSDEPPAITALLPREKTYNVAAITNNLASVGAGFVTQVIGGSFSFLHGRSTYYVVQDQDTIALTMAPTNPKNEVAFQWQFKPVLGQAFVQPGMRQTFAQVAVPIEDTSQCFGTAYIKTYWRHFDKKKGTAGDIISDSIREYTMWAIPTFDLTPVIRRVTYEDLGGGQIDVSVPGQFIDGTYVRVGNAYYRPGSPGFTFEPQRIRFVAAANDIVKDQPYLVNRDGSEVAIVDPSVRDPRSQPAGGCFDETPRLPQETKDGDEQKKKETQAEKQPDPCDSNCAVKTTTFDDSNSLLTFTIRKLPYGGPQLNGKPDLDAYTLIVANRVFGLSDSPIVRIPINQDGYVEFRAIVPTSLVTTARRASVQPLFWGTKATAKGQNYLLSANIGYIGLESTSEKIVLVGKTKDQATFMLTGNRLDSAVIKGPASACFTHDIAMRDTATIRFFTLSLDDWKLYKGVLLQKTVNERPELVTLPALDDKAASTPLLTPKYRITVGMDDVALVGDNLEKLYTNISSVTFNNTKTLAVSLALDKKSLIVSGLVAAGVTTEPITRDINFAFKDGTKATVTLEVVSSKVETTTAPTAAATTAAAK